MTITDLELFLVEVACDGRESPIRSLLVRVATDAGLEGWGESHVPWRPSELAPRRDALLSVLTGRSAFDIEELVTLEGLRDPAICSALEMASWDLVGRAAGQPLCHLFGGTYRRRIPQAVRIEAPSPAEAARLARELSDQGFHSQILTSTGKPEHDAGLVAAVGESTARRVELQFDAAGNYDMETARELCADLEEQPLESVIDPLDTDALDRVASLRRQTTLALSVHRAIRQPADVLSLIRCGAAQGVVIDLARVGGLSRARECAAVARAGAVRASLAGGPSLGIGVAAMLQLAASTPAFATCNQCAYHQLQDDLLTERLEILDGMIAVPQAPGLGVEVDRSKIEQWQVS